MAYPPSRCGRSPKHDDSPFNKSWFTNFQNRKNGFGIYLTLKFLKFQDAKKLSHTPNPFENPKFWRMFGPSPAGFMSCVVSYDLGRRCLDLLRRMMLSSDQCRRVKSTGIHEEIYRKTMENHGKDEWYQWYLWLNHEQYGVYIYIHTYTCTHTHTYNII